MGSRLPWWEIGLWGVAAAGGVLGISIVVLKAECATGDPDVDRLGFDCAKGALTHFWYNPAQAVRFARASAAIVNQETRGAPAPQIGDTTAPGGPSIGPMQVYRQTAMDLGLWTPPADEDPVDAYIQLAYDEDWCMWAGAMVLADKYRQTGTWAAAIRAYNGAGAAASRYSASVLSYAQARGWDFT